MTLKPATIRALRLTVAINFEYETHDTGHLVTMSVTEVAVDGKPVDPLTANGRQIFTCTSESLPVVLPVTIGRRASSVRRELLDIATVNLRLFEELILEPIEPRYAPGAFWTPELRAEVDSINANPEAWTLH